MGRVGTAFLETRRNRALLSPCPQLMAVVASTILDLIRNMRAFGGILVVSQAPVWAPVGAGVRQAASRCWAGCSEGGGSL